MSAILLPSSVLPFVWAVGAGPAPRIDFYRKYTEAILRRYVRMSMEAGRVPSLLGQEMFRGKVTSYRVGNFDDVVIFVHDVERSIDRLPPPQKDLICRIALHEFTILETAQATGLMPRTVASRYVRSLDALSRIFLRARILAPQICCQEAIH